MDQEWDQELIRRAQRGDQAAFQRLVERYAAVAWRTARALLPERTRAEDAVQEAWLDAWRGLASFERDRPALAPGSIVALPDGRALPIPTYLPPGFAWQEIALTNEPHVPFRFPFASMSAGGGGSRLPWERLPDYDRRVAAYLIAGDPADRVLALTQLKRDAQHGLLIGTFLVDLPAQPVPTPAAGAPAAGVGGRGRRRPRRRPTTQRRSS